MVKVVGVKFPHSLKIYDFLPGKLDIKIRSKVVVETAQDIEIGEVVYVGKELTEIDEQNPPKEVIRLAGEKDLELANKLEEKAKEFFPIFRDKIEKYKLPMSPVGVSLSLDETKAVFYFTAEGRIDFRELAKDLSRSIQKQAIMRQIGPRDEAKLIGGYGRCGRPICCAAFLTATGSVTMETVEAQYGMPKSASKVSGICGRLMCCLNYEEPTKKMPKKETA